METEKQPSVMVDLERVCTTIFEHVAIDKGFDVRTIADNVTYIDDRTTKAFKQFRDGFFGAVLVLGCKPDTTEETQESITQWANETFGPPASNMRVAARANEEMAELLRVLSVDDHHAKAAEEIADVVIVLSRLASSLSVDIQEEIDKKMAINRQREWKLDKTGHGYHVRDKAPNQSMPDEVGKAVDTIIEVADQLGGDGHPLGALLIEVSKNLCEVISVKP